MNEKQIVALLALLAILDGVILFAIFHWFGIPGLIITGCFVVFNLLFFGSLVAGGSRNYTDDE